MCALASVMVSTRATTSGRLAFVSAVAAFAVVMLGTTLPTPLYSIYGAQMGFGVVTTTIVFAVYAAGVIVALVAFGRWSDLIGRRPLLNAGAVLSAASAVVFLTAGPEWQLIVGRVLSGLSAGIYAGTATAAVIELAPPAWRHRAPAIATAANMGGLGLGPLLAGLLAEYVPNPLRTPFVVDLVLLAVVGVGLWFLPEPVAVRPGARLSLQRLSVPAEVRAVFIRAAIAAFAGFAVLGTFSGMAPTFLARVIGVDDHAVAGVLVATIFVVSAAAQIASRPIPTERALIAGCALLIIGVALLMGALIAASLPLLFVGAVVTGVGQGFSFGKGLAAVVGASPADRRAEVTSTYFVVAYVAMSIPIVGQGLAAARWDLGTVGVAFDAGVGVLALVALLLTIGAVVRSRPPLVEQATSTTPLVEPTTSTAPLVEPTTSTAPLVEQATSAPPLVEQATSAARSRVEANNPTPPPHQNPHAPAG
ncbi:hypothetical protein GCM10009624_04650 [Gordonia sinesedis]